MEWSQAARVAKRVMDVVIALACCVVLLPLLGALALMVKVTSPGPAFFRQRRVGRSGKIFHIFKFRSMVADAERVMADDPGLSEKYRANDFKIDAVEDPRITSVGRFLRRTSLDEFPQLLNVIRGEMSLVGPRPVVEPELSIYGPFVHHYLAVRPGMTGAWQVNGRSSIGQVDRVALDRQYVEGWSLARDVAILARTVPATLRQRGAG